MTPPRPAASQVRLLLCADFLLPVRAPRMLVLLNPEENVLDIPTCEGMLGSMAEGAPCMLFSKPNAGRDEEPCILDRP